MTTHLKPGDFQIGIRVPKKTHEALVAKVSQTEFENVSLLLRVFINAYMEDRLTIKPKDRSLINE